MKYACGLTVTRLDSAVEVRVRNPWDSLRYLGTYLLVERDKPVPSHLPEGTVIRIPVRNALVYSNVHNSLLEELGASDAIGGVCNAEYVRGPLLRQRLQEGTVTDCGPDMSPDTERILALHPEVIMLSPYENNDRYGKIDRYGIPLLQCADYMEPNPLARAEWVRFYGMLFGCSAKADSLFSETENRYLQLKAMAAATTSRPQVLLDRKYGATWGVPAGRSVTGMLIEDAGGTNPFSHIEGNGSELLNPEQVYLTGHNAAIWLIKYHSPQALTLQQLAKDDPVCSRFRAFSEGNVYGCNTSLIGYYEETPFHPDRLLEDYIRIIHPELADSLRPLRYFTPLAY